MSEKRRLVMMVLLEIDSRISSSASARAINSETRDAAMLEINPFSALGSFAKGASFERILS